MRNFFTFCMAGVFALAFTACSDDDDNNSGQSGTITIGNKTEKVESAFTTTIPSEENDEGGSYILFFEEDFKVFPETEPNFYVGLVISDSCFGKQIDLTETLSKSGTFTPFLMITDPTHSIEIDSEGVYTYPNGLTASGSLKSTRNSGKFSVKFTVTFSDGHTIAGNWSGTPKEGAIIGK